MTDMRKLINIITEAYQPAVEARTPRDLRPAPMPIAGTDEPSDDDLELLRRYLATPTDPEDSPEEAVFRREIISNIHRALDGLPPMQARAMRTWMEHGAMMMPSRLGKLMDPPISDVRSATLVRKALMSLRKDPVLRGLWQGLPGQARWGG